MTEDATKSESSATGAAEVPAPPGDGAERRSCKLCGRPIVIVNDAKTGKKIALDESTPVLAAVRTTRGPWCYGAGQWMAAARALANEEAFAGHLRDTMRFYVNHQLVCSGINKSDKTT